MDSTLSEINLFEVADRLKYLSASDSLNIFEVLFWKRYQDLNETVLEDLTFICNIFRDLEESIHFEKLVTAIQSYSITHQKDALTLAVNMFASNLSHRTYSIECLQIYFPANISSLK